MPMLRFCGHDTDEKRDIKRDFPLPLSPEDAVTLADFVSRTVKGNYAWEIYIVEMKEVVDHIGQWRPWR